MKAYRYTNIAFPRHEQFFPSVASSSAFEMLLKVFSRVKNIYPIKKNIDYDSTETGRRSKRASDSYVGRRWHATHPTQNRNVTGRPAWQAVTRSAPPRRPTFPNTAGLSSGPGLHSARPDLTPVFPSPSVSLGLTWPYTSLPLETTII